jgi:hypothetical protein
MKRTFVESSNIYFIHIVLLLSLCLSSCFASGGELLTGTCNDQIYSQSHAPNQEFSATVLYRDCGATTSFSTIVTLKKRTEENNFEQDKIFVIAGKNDISLKWRRNNSLKIRYNLDEIFLKATQAKGISIEYEQVTRK